MQQAPKKIVTKPLTGNALRSFFAKVRKDNRGRLPWVPKQNDELNVAWMRLMEEAGVQISPDTGSNLDCWEWDGSKDGKDQRPRLWVDGRSQVAARLSVATYLQCELIFKEDEADHRCQNRGCVRPDHCLRLSVKDHKKVTAYTANPEGFEDERGIAQIAPGLWVINPTAGQKD